MPREKKIFDEADVKEKIVKPWFKSRNAFQFMVVQAGMGRHGIHDHIACVPTVVTPAMVGKTIGMFVSVEAKRPGRREEPRRGMSPHQKDFMDEVNQAGGFSIVADSEDDMAALAYAIERFRQVPHA